MSSHPETLREAIAWDARRDAYAESGLSPRESARRAWAEPEKPADPGEPAALLKMLSTEGDAKIVRDLDCYPCRACRKITCPVCEYAKARKQVRGFSAKNYQKNSHRGIPELTIKRLKKLAQPPARRRQVTCQNCERDFEAQRSSAKWCSPRCRVAGNAA